MILYTVVPIEDVLDEGDEPTLMSANFLGCTLLVEPIGDGRGRVERVLSTDPNHYLNNAIQPGSVIHLHA